MLFYGASGRKWAGTLALPEQSKTKIKIAGKGTFL